MSFLTIELAVLAGILLGFGMATFPRTRLPLEDIMLNNDGNAEIIVHDLTIDLEPGDTIELIHPLNDVLRYQVHCPTFTLEVDPQDIAPAAWDLFGKELAGENQRLRDEIERLSIDLAVAKGLYRFQEHATERAA